MMLCYFYDLGGATGVPTKIAPLSPGSDQNLTPSPKSSQRVLEEAEGLQNDAKVVPEGAKIDTQGNQN